MQRYMLYKLLHSPNPLPVFQQSTFVQLYVCTILQFFFIEHNNNAPVFKQCSQNVQNIQKTHKIVQNVHRWPQPIHNVHKKWWDTERRLSSTSWASKFMFIRAKDKCWPLSSSLLHHGLHQISSGALTAYIYKILHQLTNMTSWGHGCENNERIAF